MTDTATVADLYEKVKWLLLVITRLWKQKFSGTLMLDFHQGNLCTEYKVQYKYDARELQKTSCKVPEI